jgi:MFS family permease
MVELPRPLTAEERRKGERIFLAEAACVSSAGAFIEAPVVASLLKTIGAPPWLTTLLLSGHFVGGLSQLFAPLFIERARSRKKVCLRFFGVARSLRVAIAFLLLLLLTPLKPYYVFIYFLAEMTMGAFGAVAMIGRLSWVADLVPEGELGDFWARRQMTSHVLGLLLPLLAGLAVTAWQSRYPTLPGALPVFVALYMLSGLCSIGSWICFTLAPEPPFQPDPQGPRLVRSLRKPLSDPEYRPLVLFRFLFSLSGGLALGMASAYLIQVLDVTAGAVSAFQALGTLVGLYTMLFWGRMTDKFGCRPVLLVGNFAMGLFHLSWVFVGRSTWWLAGPLYLLFLFQSSLQPAMMTVASKLAPVAGRPAYLAAQSVAAHLGWAVGPLIGAGLAASLDRLAPGGVLGLHSLQAVMALAGLMRWASLATLARLREPGGRTLGRVIQVFAGHAAFRPTRGLRAFLAFWLAPILAASEAVAQTLGAVTQNVQERIESLRSAEAPSKEGDRDEG